MKTRSLSAVALFAGFFLSTTEIAALELNDYCDLSVCTPKSIKEITPLSDGQTFAAMSDDGKKIEIYSFKTGKKTGELFDVDKVKGDVKISEFDGFEVSKNGKKILLWNEKEKIYRYSFTAEYYVYDTFRSTLQRVSQNGRQRAATMSHDGRYVAYVRDNNVFISNLDYKTDLPVTKDGEINKIIYGVADWSYEEEFDIRNTLCWNNDDTVLAFMRFDESEVPVYSFDNYTGSCEENYLKQLYPKDFEYKYPLPGFKNSKVSVLAYNLDNKVIKTMDLPITESDYVPSVAFDGDEKNLMVMILNHDQNNLRLFSVNPASTVSRLVMTQTSTTWLSPTVYQKVRYEKGNFIIFSEESGYKHLYLYDYNGNKIRQITKGDFNVTNYYGKDKLGNYYFQSTIDGPINRTISVVDSKGGLKRLSKEGGTAEAWFSSTLDYYCECYSNSQTPPQYTLHDNKGTKTADIELNQEYARKYADAPKMEFLKVKNAVGEDMNAFVIKPSGFNSTNKYPLVMYQYNGPDSQEVLNKWRMEGIFYLASKGYVVACVDGRGTGNRTNAWTKSVYKELGVKETEDQLAGAAYFASLPYVDASRTSCFGWSYGGYMTMMEMGDPNCKFKCGISMAGVSDWRYYDALYTERFMQTPGQNESGYEKSSAIARIKNVKGRLLLISGANDDNVHMINTLKYGSALSGEGQVVDMMIYPGFEHSLRMCDARPQLFRKIEDFLNLHLK